MADEDDRASDRGRRVAEAVAAALYPKDHAAHALGIKLVDVGAGLARMSMTVRRDMLNGHATCHGGMIFTLADTTFAYACNSNNHVTVAQNCSISFLASPREGDVLTATAQRRQRGGRTGLYDIDVTDQTGRLIAVFRGHAYQLNREVVPNLETDQ